MRPSVGGQGEQDRREWRIKEIDVLILKSSVDRPPLEHRAPGLIPQRKVLALAGAKNLGPNNGGEKYQAERDEGDADPWPSAELAADAGDRLAKSVVGERQGLTAEGNTVTLNSFSILSLGHRRAW